jgi:hypothetical protein
MQCFSEPLSGNGVILRYLQSFKKPHAQSEAEVGLTARASVVGCVLEASQATDEVVPFEVLGLVAIPVSEICEFDV